jgi:hypothetical protein
MGETHGTVLQENGLNSLAEWTKKRGLPMITGIVVNQNPPRKPSGGYFGLNDSGLADDVWWEQEVRNSVGFDWTPFVGAAVVAELRARTAVQPAEETDPPETPTARDNVELPPAERQKVEIYRTLRDSAKARRVKQRHRYRCQVCAAEPIALFDGSPYAEAHHIRPLGGLFFGPDEEWNVLCVCPRCHVLLDYGVIALDFEKLLKADGHQLDEAMIDYHNEKIFGKK